MDEAHRQRWLLLALVVGLAGVCYLQAVLGAFPTRIYGHDLFVFLNGGWRVASGQIPYVDFYSGLGVLVWKPIQWAFMLHGYNADAIGLARAFYTAVLGIWFLGLILRQPLRGRSVVLWLFFVIFVSSPRPLGEYPTWISHAMFYNRACYALVFLVMFEQLGSCRFHASDSSAGRHQLGFGEGFSSGAALACTLLIKISFVIPAATLLGAGLVFFGASRRQIAGVLAGVFTVIAAAVLFLHFEPAAFLRETLILSRERGGRLSSQLVSVLVNTVGQVLFTLAAGVAIATASFVKRRVVVQYTLATMVIVGCDVFCRGTSAMRGDLPLSAFWCLIGTFLLVSSPAAAEGLSLLRLRFVVPLLLLSPVVLPLVLADFTSTGYAAFKTAVLPRHETLRFDSGALRSWVPQDWKGDDPTWLDENGGPLVLITNDGERLLRRFSSANETIASISFVNPFSFALGRRPPQGGAVWLDPNNNVSQYRPLPVEMLIGRPDVLMVENSMDADAANIRALFEVDYPGLLTNDYVFVGKSQFWTLYRRRGSQPQATQEPSVL